MKRYRVTLTGLAIVSQVQTVEAEDEQDARDRSLERVSEYVWEYEELYDGRAGQIEIIDVREEQ